jgi:hypothetical protein
VKIDEQGKPQYADVLEADDLSDRPGGREFPCRSVDAQARFAAPHDGAFVVSVQDRAASSDPRAVYWLSIHRESPDFALVAKAGRVSPDPRDNNTSAEVWQPLVRSGGSAAIDLLVERRDGFDGAIDLSVEGLPTGVRAQPALVPAGQESATIVLSADEGTPSWSGPVEVFGRAQIGDAEVIRRARKATLIWPCRPNDRATPAGEARLTADLYVSTSGQEPAPFAALAETPSAEIARGGQVSVPVKVLRRGDFKGSVVVQPQRLPPNVEAQPVTIEADQDAGTLTLQAKPDAPLGEFDLMLAVVAEAPYSRNPEAARAAVERKARLDAKVDELSAGAKQVTEAQAAASAAAESAGKALAEATQRNDELAAKATELAAKLQAAEQARAAAQSAAEAAAAQAQAAAEALAAADLAAKQAQEAAKAAQQAQSEASTALETARKQAETTAQAKAAADEAASGAAAKLQAASDARAAAEKRANELAEAAKPKNVRIAAPLAPRLRLLPAPLKLSGSRRIVAAAGGQLELEVTLTRLPGFADAVELALVPPEGVTGLPTATATVAADQNSARLAAPLGAEAPLGKHRYSLRAKVKVNGQELQATRPVLLVIEPAQAE